MIPEHALGRVLEASEVRAGRELPRERQRRTRVETIASAGVEAPSTLSRKPIFRVAGAVSENSVSRAAELSEQGRSVSHEIGG
jgi:hypothetical protein